MLEQLYSTVELNETHKIISSEYYVFSSALIQSPSK